MNHYLLTLLTFLPLAAAGIIACFGDVKFAKWFSLIISFVCFALALNMWFYFDGSSSNVQFLESYIWIPELGVKYIVGVDGISLLLVVLTCFLTPLIFISQWHVTEERQRGLLALMLVLQSGMLGSLVALDLVFFYFFWEAMLIPMYFIIGLWGGKRRIYATTKFVLYTVFGSLLMLVAALALYFAHYEQMQVYSTSLFDLYHVKLSLSQQLWMFGAFGLAFAIKVPMWPFHTWLPDAHVEAPTVGSVILAGVLLKLGTYGLLRFGVPLFPEAVQHFAPVIMFLGVVGIIYGALTAWVQQDAKKMVAYSSVSHLGFVILGCFAINLDGEFSLEALTGANYQMINHGISTGALFFLVGCIYERRHTRMLSDFGGLAKNMPWFATFLIITMLSSVGLPGTGGFVGEFLILIGAFKTSAIVGLFASLGVLLGAIYMLTLCRKVLFGPLDKVENQELKDLSTQEFIYLTPLVILCVVMGIFPNFFLAKSRVAIENLAKNYAHYELNFVQNEKATLKILVRK